MDNIIKVEYIKDRPIVSARELHEFLEVETPFRIWFPRMAEYGFLENIDYTPYNFVHPLNGQNCTDYQLILEMAKEICMLQRNDKGKQARQYFIQLEKEWNSPEKIMARALQIANKQIADTKKVNLKLAKKIEIDKPKVLFANAVSESNDLILVGELAKLLKQNGIEIGEDRFYKWLREKEYLIKRKGTDYNRPTQKSMNLGIFKVTENAITRADGKIRICRTTKVTGKGQQYFTNIFLKNKKEL